MNVVYWLLDELLEKHSTESYSREAEMILRSFQRSSSSLRSIVKSRMGSLLVAEIEPTFEYPIKFLKETSPILLTREYELVEEEHLKQLLISFNCMRKLRYRHVKESRFEAGYMDL